VEVRLPGGSLYPVAVAEAARDGHLYRAVVIKDAGDDPDVTHRARIGVTLGRSPVKGLSISGGPGVGRLTKPGLVLPPGEWAINPVPRAMLLENLSPYLEEGGPGLDVRVFVEKGEELARRTLNPRLGILGGISILGTSGLVKPFSHQAYVATVDSSLSMAKAAGLREVILTTGGRSEKIIRSIRTDLPEEAFVQIADFYRESLEMAARKGFASIGLAVFFGKAVKQAQGLAYTHAHQSQLSIPSLVSWLPDLGESLKGRLLEAPTALAALECLKKARALRYLPLVAERQLQSMRAFVGPGPRIWVRILDFDGSVLSFLEERA
jgi:cobalt-precorrin-5B (C1)-methyltransferase